MVSHLRSVHVPYSASGVHHISGVHHSVVECHHYRCRLEHRTRFEQVRHGVVLYLGIVAACEFRHVHHCLDVAGAHLHHDSHSHVAVDFLQLLQERPLAEVLHSHVDCRYDVASGHRRHDYLRYRLVEHLAYALLSRCAAQVFVERLFQSAFRLPVPYQVTDCSACERSEGLLPRRMLHFVESSSQSWLSEHRQPFHLRHLLEGSSPLYYSPALVLLVVSLLQPVAEILLAFVREYTVQPGADFREIGSPHGVAPLLTHAEVYYKVIFRQCSGQQPSVAAQYVSAFGRFRLFLYLFLFRHFHPVFTLQSAHINHLSDDQQADKHGNPGYYPVSLHRFGQVLLSVCIHCSGTFII